MKNAVDRVGVFSTAAVILLYLTIFSGTFLFNPVKAPPSDALSVLLRSVLFSTLSALAAGAIAVPVAYFLSRHTFPGSRFVDALLEFPLVLSPVALGTLILIFFSRGPGHIIENYITEVLYTWKAIIVAQVMVVFALALRVIKTAFDMIPRRYEEIARTLGISKTRTLLTITLPLAKSGIISGFMLAWARAMGEFGASITVAGMHPQLRTIPIAIFERLENVDIGGALYYVIILAGVSILTLYVVRRITEGEKTREP